MLSLAPVKSRLVLPFWYRLTRVVPVKGSLNGHVCACAGIVVGKQRRKEETCITSVLNVPPVSSDSDVVPETTVSHSDVDLRSVASLQEFTDSTYPVGYF